MEPQNILGLYISKDSATAVCLALQGNDHNVLGCFSISDQEKDGQNFQMLANLIAHACTERGLEFSEVAVALDSAMFMQHNVHSDFTDPKQISATVRFDTEEALATDIADVAIAFKITSSDQAGSDLTVFTAQRKILSDILLSLQSNNIDPISIEPDVSCLSRFICRDISFSEGLHPLFGILSRRRGYLIVPPISAGLDSQKTPIVRTFLVGRTQDRSELLARETLITTALIESREPINSIKVFDSAYPIDCQRLSKKFGIEVSELDLVGSAVADQQSLTNCDDLVDFAVAYGAALSHLGLTHTINFRNDFMPYQGGKIRLQKALKFASYSVAVLILAIGMYFQVQLFKVNNSRNKLYNRLAKDYAVVMPGHDLKRKASPSPTTKLKSELRRVREAKGTISIKGGKTVSSKLVLVLQSINSCIKQADLNIGSISITDRNINIAGDTSSRSNTLKFFDAIEKNGMEIQQQHLYIKDRRDHFSITVESKSG